MQSLKTDFTNLVFFQIWFFSRSARVRREVKRGLGLHRGSGSKPREGWSQSLNTNKRHKLKRLKSFSCPQLLISSDCDAVSTSLPVPVAKLGRSNIKTTRFMPSLALEQPRTNVEESATHSETCAMISNLTQEDDNSAASFPDPPNHEEKTF